MQAFGYRQPLPLSDPNAIVAFEAPAPVPGPHDLLVRVAAVSVNPVDVKQRANAAPAAGTTRILGFDASGVVEAVGAEVTLFQPGDEVFYAGSIARPGSNAELQAVDARIVGPKPRRLSHAEAAALPLTAITAWELLFDRLGVARDTAATGTLLVVGGAGGVGSILIQLARQLTGLTVIATASRPETRDWCLALGAHHVVDHRGGLEAAVKAAGFEQVDLVAGLTATDQHWPAICALVAPQGKVGLIDDPKTVDPTLLKRKSASLHWEFMFARSLWGTADMIEQHRLLTEVARLVDGGTLRTTLTEPIGPLGVETLKRAHALVESGTMRGKAVLTVG
ncbi:MAG: zinc-binding alcohol dehydrogenase family protein [Rhodospirillales bacterium]|nr:zinc-binding alcohol dehydrogenase family protein [Rhodospirillales bacterium]